MAGDNQIGLEAIFNDEDFQKGISGYNSSVSDSSSRTESAAGGMSYAWEGMAAVGEVAFASIAIGVAAMTAALYLAVDAAMDAEDAMARVDFVVAGTAERTGVTTDAVNELAGQLSSVYPIDDEVIAQAIAMGLTFDGVNKDNIQPLITAAADLAAWTGRDLPSTMKSLSLAISDPDKAMRLLKEANITLSDEQMKTLKSFKDQGDAAGATTFLLDELKKKGIIGLGKAMGDTAKGKMTIMQTALGNIQEALGGGLLNALGEVFDRISAFANNPDTVDFFTKLGEGIGEFAGMVLDNLPDAMAVVKDIGSWLAQNKPIIVGVLAAIGVALLAFGYTAAAAGIAAMAGLWPVIAVMVVVGAAVGLLYKAWTENWGGIREKVAAAWAEMKPVFDKLKAWLEVNLPKAIKALSTFWTNTLLPAIKKAFSWIADNVIPILVDLVLWLGDNVPKAIKTLSNFWTNTLLPAIKIVFGWIESNVFPLLVKLVQWLGDNLPKAIQTLANFWTNTLLPAIKAVASFFTNVLIPAFQATVSFMAGVFTSAITALSAIWKNVLLPAITAVYNFFNNYIMPVFNAVSNLMNAVMSVALRALAGLWQNVLLPALNAVWSFIQNSLMPVFNAVSSVLNGAITTAVKSLSDLWENTFNPAIQKVWDLLKPFGDFLSDVLGKAISGIRDAFFDTVDSINGLADALSNLQLPAWLTPGKKLELGINDELNKLTRASLPAIQQQINVLASVRDVPGSSTSAGSPSISNSSQSTRNYLYGASFNVTNQSGMIEILQGLS